MPNQDHPNQATGSDLFCVVLAAGLSSRFGTAKQLAGFRGRPLVASAMQLAESVFGRRSVLVAGYEWQAVASACAPLAGFLVVNERYARGLGNSIASGVAAVAECAAGVLLLLADQPMINIAYVERMRSLWLENPDRIVVSEFDGNIGPPVIFPASFFGALLALDGDRGARQVLRENETALLRLQCANAAIDIDAVEDLERINLC